MLMSSVGCRGTFLTEEDTASRYIAVHCHYGASNLLIKAGTPPPVYIVLTLFWKARDESSLTGSLETKGRIPFLQIDRLVCVGEAHIICSLLDELPPTLPLLSLSLSPSPSSCLSFPPFDGLLAEVNNQYPMLLTAWKSLYSVLLNKILVCSNCTRSSYI